MRVVKRLYLFILKSFLPLFAMTFFIVLFIVLMQFLWRYIDDLVGKGLSFGVLGELFFYAAVSMVPMALPLAILLASLMTFGNLGEKSELTAIKASGVSLVKTMSPLIVLVSLIAVGAFFFQNDVLPRAQVKMWTLLFSARQKSPELEIPEGVFYDQIPGYNLYVKSKNPATGMLHDVMIYDVSHGGDNSTILLADSARLAFTKDMRYLYLHLYQGEQFENLREQKTTDSNVPFRRESFFDKEVLIPFDANFTRLDEQGMRNQYVGKNMSELRQTIDSLTLRIDSIGKANVDGFGEKVFPVLMGERHGGMSAGPPSFGSRDPFAAATEVPADPFAKENNKEKKDKKEKKESTDVAPLDLDSLIKALEPSRRDGVYANAANICRMRASELEFRAMQIGDEKQRLRRHRIELIKKFTLSVACIIMLFIGAPLGAIIRKGGLGAPLVISVLLFLVYYIIDNTGYKMAREGYWDAWAGMWLSTFILLPLGIFVTYKAMNDSAVFNPDLYKNWIRLRLGLPESRHVPVKEVIINDVNVDKAIEMLGEASSMADSWLRVHKQRPGYADFWRKGYDPAPINELGELLDRICDYLSDSKDLKVNALLNKLPVMRSLWIMQPVSGADVKIRKGLMWIFPIGLPVYLLSLPYDRRIWRQMRAVSEVTSKMTALLDPSKIGVPTTPKF